MRVAIVSAVTGFHRDTERTWRTGRLASLLAARGHEVTVFSAQWWTGSRPTFAHDGVAYHRLTGHPADRGFGSHAAARLASHRPDVVHAVHDDPRHVLGASAGATLARAPLVVDWYDYARGGAGGLPGLWRALGDRLIGRAARAGDAVLVPSRTVGTRVRELGAPDDRVSVLPNPVEFDLVRETPPAEAGDIVYSRRLDVDANLESLLLALAEFRDRDWSATVVGDGPARETYEEQAADLRIDDRVTFAGDRPVAERIALFKRAHVYVHTARRTPFPTDLARALACGCVGVVEYHAESSAHELVEGERRGFLATDDEALVNCLRAAADEPRREVDESFADYAEDAVVRELVARYESA